MEEKEKESRSLSQKREKWVNWQLFRERMTTVCVTAIFMLEWTVPSSLLRGFKSLVELFRKFTSVPVNKNGFFFCSSLCHAYITKFRMALQVNMRQSLILPTFFSIMLHGNLPQRFCNLFLWELRVSFYELRRWNLHLQQMEDSIISLKNRIAIGKWIWINSEDLRDWNVGISWYSSESCVSDWRQQQL